MKKISEVMTTDVQTVSGDQTAREAAGFLAASAPRPGSIPVCEGDKVIGIITDRDIAVRGVAEGRGPDTLVRDLMSDGTVVALSDQGARLPITKTERDAALGRGDLHLRDVHSDGRHYRMLTVPTDRGVAIELARSLSEVDGALRGLGFVLTLVSGIGIAHRRRGRAARLAA